MKIAYITTYNSKDLYQWSGLGTHVAMSLEQQKIKLDYFQLQPPPHSLILAARIRNIPSYALWKRAMLWRSPSILRFYARQIEIICRSKKNRLLFSPGSRVFSYYDGTCPYAFWTDATFASMLDYYPEYINVSNAGIENG